MTVDAGSRGLLRKRRKEYASVAAHGRAGSGSSSSSKNNKSSPLRLSRETPEPPASRTNIASSGRVNSAKALSQRAPITPDLSVFSVAPNRAWGGRASREYPITDLSHPSPAFSPSPSVSRSGGSSHGRSRHRSRTPKTSPAPSTSYVVDAPLLPSTEQFASTGFGARSLEMLDGLGVSFIDLNVPLQRTPSQERRKRASNTCYEIEDSLQETARYSCGSNSIRTHEVEGVGRWHGSPSGEASRRNHMDCHSDVTNEDDEDVPRQMLPRTFATHYLLPLLPSKANGFWSRHARTFAPSQLDEQSQEGSPTISASNSECDEATSVEKGQRRLYQQSLNDQLRSPIALGDFKEGSKDWNFTSIEQRLQEVRNVARDPKGAGRSSLIRSRAAGVQGPTLAAIERPQVEDPAQDDHDRARQLEQKKLKMKAKASQKRQRKRERLAMDKAKKLEEVRDTMENLSASEATEPRMKTAAETTSDCTETLVLNPDPPSLSTSASHLILPSSQLLGDAVKETHLPPSRDGHVEAEKAANVDLSAPNASAQGEVANVASPLLDPRDVEAQAQSLQRSDQSKGSPRNHMTSGDVECLVRLGSSLGHHQNADERISNKIPVTSPPMSPQSVSSRSMSSSPPLPPALLPKGAAEVNLPHSASDIRDTLLTKPAGGTDEVPLTTPLPQDLKDTTVRDVPTDPSRLTASSSHQPSSVTAVRSERCNIEPHIEVAGKLPPQNVVRPKISKKQAKLQMMGPPKKMAAPRPKFRTKKKAALGRRLEFDAADIANKIRAAESAHLPSAPPVTASEQVSRSVAKTLTNTSASGPEAAAPHSQATETPSPTSHRRHSSRNTEASFHSARSTLLVEDTSDGSGNPALFFAAESSPRDYEDTLLTPAFHDLSRAVVTSSSLSTTFASPIEAKEVPFTPLDGKRNHTDIVPRPSSPQPVTRIQHRTYSETLRRNLPKAIASTDNCSDDSAVFSTPGTIASTFRLSNLTASESLNTVSSVATSMTSEAHDWTRCADEEEELRQTSDLNNLLGLYTSNKSAEESQLAFRHGNYAAMKRIDTKKGLVPTAAPTILWQHGVEQVENDFLISRYLDERRAEWIAAYNAQWNDRVAEHVQVTKLANDDHHSRSNMCIPSSAFLTKQSLARWAISGRNVALYRNNTALPRKILSMWEQAIAASTSSSRHLRLWASRQLHEIVGSMSQVVPLRASFIMADMCRHRPNLNCLNLDFFNSRRMEREIRQSEDGRYLWEPVQTLEREEMQDYDSAPVAPPSNHKLWKLGSHDPDLTIADVVEALAAERRSEGILKEDVVEMYGSGPGGLGEVSDKLYLALSPPTEQQDEEALSVLADELRGLRLPSAATGRLNSHYQDSHAEKLKSLLIGIAVDPQHRTEWLADMASVPAEEQSSISAFFELNNTQLHDMFGFEGVQGDDATQQSRWPDQLPASFVLHPSDDGAMGRHGGPSSTSVSLSGPDFPAKRAPQGCRSDADLICNAPHTCGCDASATGTKVYGAGGRWCDKDDHYRFQTFSSLSLKAAKSAASSPVLRSRAIDQDSTAHSSALAATADQRSAEVIIQRTRDAMARAGYRSDRAAGLQHERDTRVSRVSKPGSIFGTSVSSAPSMSWSHSAPLEGTSYQKREKNDVGNQSAASWAKKRRGDAGIKSFVPRDKRTQELMPVMPHNDTSASLSVSYVPKTPNPPALHDPAILLVRSTPWQHAASPSPQPQTSSRSSSPVLIDRTALNSVSNRSLSPHSCQHEVDNALVGDINTRSTQRPYHDGFNSAMSRTSAAQQWWTNAVASAPIQAEDFIVDMYRRYRLLQENQRNVELAKSELRMQQQNLEEQSRVLAIAIAATEHAEAGPSQPIS